MPNCHAVNKKVIAVNGEYTIDELAQRFAALAIRG